MNDNIVQHFRQHYNLPLDRACPQRPIIGFQHVNLDPHAAISARNHYCAFYFDVSHRTLDIIGFNYNSDEAVSGPLSEEETMCFVPVCERLYKLCGWNQWDEDTPDQITVFQKNSRQNGYDCGPITCEVIEYILLYGFHRRGRYWNQPMLHCGHQMRHRMAVDIGRKIQENIASFDNLPTILTRQQLDNIFQQDWEACSFMKNDLLKYYQDNPGQRFQDIVQQLQKFMSRCPDCKRRDNRDPSPPPTLVGLARQSNTCNPEAAPPQPVPASSEEFLNSSPAQIPTSSRSSASPDLVEKPMAMSSQASDHDETDNPAIANKDVHVRDFSQAQPSRFPRPMPPPQLPPLKRGVQLRLRNQNPKYPFDDYEDRPLREDMEPIPHLSLNWAGGDV
ncbi:hypothetical protein H0H81_001530, partial [Sphagnurus paluster]